jgi:hypothetical protein
MLNSWQTSLIAATASGTALANSAAATSLLPAQAKFTLWQNFFERVGQKIRILAAGQISTLATTPGTLTLDVRFGSTVVVNGGAMTLNANAQVNVNWLLELEITCRAIGATANLIGQGRFQSHAVIGSAAPTAGGAGAHLLPYNTAPVVGNNFDATAQQQVDLFGTWQTANAANSIQLHQYELISVN